MKYAFTFIITLCLWSSSLGQSNTSSIFSFLEVTPTARLTALGGNHVGLYNSDFSTINLNPAYLNTQSSGKVSASFVNLLADAKMGFTSGAWTFEEIGTFGAGIRFVSYGDMDHFDEEGNNLGGFNAIDLAFTGAYGLNLTGKWRAGAALDLIHSSYFDYKSSAVALAGGIFYQDTTNHLSAGLAIRNLGAQIDPYDERREPLPLDISIGATHKPEKFPFQVSLTLRKLNVWDLRTFGESKRPAVADNLFRHIIVGGETYFGDNVQLRLGYDRYLYEQTNTGKDFELAGLTFGLGITIRSIIIDLSRSSYSRLGGITQLSVKTRIN